MATHAKSLQSCFDSVTLWTVAHQAALSRDSPGKNTEVFMLSSRGSSLEESNPHLCIGRWVLYP